MSNQTFPGFEYSAEDLSAYLLCMDVFIISLMSTQIIHFTTPDVAAFREWLDRNGVRDITHEAGSLVMEYYKMK